MNNETMKSLEFQRILEAVADYAITDAGKEKVLDMKPSLNIKQITLWLEEVTEAVQITRKSSSVPIHGLSGIEKLLQSLHKGVPLRLEQLSSLNEFLDCCMKIRRFMADKGYYAPRVSSYVESIEELPFLASEIVRCIRNGRVDDYATKDLLKIRKQLAIQEERLKEKLNQMLKSSKIKPYLQESIISQRNGRYVIAVKKEYKTKVKGTLLDMSASGSTCYIEPEEIALFQEEMAWLIADEEREVEKVLYYLTGLAEEKEREIRLAVETMVHYDVLFSKAKYSNAINGQPVNLNEAHYIDLKNARHPLLGEHAVPLNIEMGRDYHALLITGPNTGGKTVAIKTVGLLTSMAQCGLHIPVDAGSTIAVFQKVLVDIGDGQSIEHNLSTFSSRIVNIREILKETNDRSLVLLDELGSGTDPGEGMGLATAILEQLHNKGASLLATTHYSEIKEFADRQSGFINGSMEFDLETLRPTYRLKIGTGGESQAFAIALKLGIHPKIIERAHQITYRESKEFQQPADLPPSEKSEQDKQIILNRHIRRGEAAVAEKKSIPAFSIGDSVQVSNIDDSGIIYKGPDAYGNYIVQVKGEKMTVNHKRLTLIVAASELYPDDYDFDIIFETKENRKKSKLLNKKHVEGLTIEHEA
ncbi:endonuclease MutS2 [Bacillus sp. T33-2]|uniref:endonuclease MutS2 n=1 Tax=Bacillus sp. T33-2 TaxID=2054168 RepID=UPI000C783B2E|nr:DNA mismatch repair protein [Bacillus sp. T33-2]PLR98781.1 DNA mismatch repair protein [Bacillus sp. T33-2]